MSLTRHIVFDCDGTLLNIEQGGRPYEGIVELLERLKEQDFHLYVWTGRDRASTNRLLNEKNLMKYFDDTRTVSEVAPKPHPEGLQQMLAQVNPQHVAMIGDSWTDMKGAQVFGCLAVGALWNPRAEKEALKEFGAQILVSTPGECYDALLGYFQG